jgi:predicted porin
MKPNFRSTSKWVAGSVLLASTGLAQAQSSVTLYGVLDVALQYASKTATATGKNAGSTFAVANAANGPSVFGMKGTEDLGGGLKATFTLESGISVANGGFAASNGNLWGRQAWVGLEGNFGKIRLGTQFSPFFLTLLDSDPRYFSSSGSGNLIYADNVIFTGVANSNAVLYSSPKFGGFEGSVMFAPGGVPGNFQAGRQWSASLKYDNGSLLINTSIYDGNAGGAATPVPTNVEFLGRTVGLGYRFGPLFAKASFVNYKVAGSFNNNVYGGGLDYFATTALDLNGGVWVTSDRNATSNHSLLAAVGATYLLSKATSLYMQLTTVDNHGAMRTGLSLDTTAIVHGVAGTSYGANVGIRHTF